MVRLSKAIEKGFEALKREGRIGNTNRRGSRGAKCRLANIDMRHETKEDKLRACDPAADDWDATNQWIGLDWIGLD